MVRSPMSFSLFWYDVLLITLFHFRQYRGFREFLSRMPTYDPACLPVVSRSISFSSPSPRVLKLVRAEKMVFLVPWDRSKRLQPDLPR